MTTRVIAYIKIYQSLKQAPPFPPPELWYDIMTLQNVKKELIRGIVSDNLTSINCPKVS